MTAAQLPEQSIRAPLRSPDHIIGVTPTTDLRIVRNRIQDPQKNPGRSQNVGDQDFSNTIHLPSLGMIYPVQGRLSIPLATNAPGTIFGEGILLKV